MFNHNKKPMISVYVRMHIVRVNPLTQGINLLIYHRTPLCGQMGAVLFCSLIITNKLETSRCIGNRSKHMKTTEHIGHISAIHNSYGVVYSETYDEEYYYEIEKQNRNLKVNDKVVFLLKKESYSSIDETAIALRKVYTNSKGIKFYSRVNQEHVHLNLDEFVPVIIEEVMDDERDIVEVEHVFQNNIGFTSCLEINESDNIIYAIRNGRNKHTKFVLGRVKTPCDSIFAVFKRTEYGYLIITIFIGKKAGREPWDNFATLEDKKFWSNHALVFDSSEVKRGSITSVCPW